MPSGDHTATSAVRSTLEHAALTVPQQQRLSRLRELHHEIRLNGAPGDMLEATVVLGAAEQHIFREQADDLLDRVQEVIETDPDG